MSFDAVTFVSMVSDKTVPLRRENLPAGEIDFLSSAIAQGGATFLEEGIELVVDRPKGSVSGDALDGALVYFFRKVGEEEVICGGVVCWDEEWAPESWEFVRNLQMAADVVLQGPDRAQPAPWAGGFVSSAYSACDRATKERLGDLEQAVIFAAIRGNRPEAETRRKAV